MNRSQLIERLKPLLAPAIEKLTTDVITKVLARAESALDVAGKLALDAVTTALEGSHVEKHDERSADRRANRKKPRRSRARSGNAGKARNTAPDRGRDRPSAAKSEIVRAPAPVAQATPAVKKRAQMKCRKCGALGFRSDGCGKTHNVIVERDVMPANLLPPPSRADRSDRFSRIKSAARARREGVIA